MPELLEDFLKPSPNIDSTDLRIINQAGSLAEKCFDKKGIIEKLFRFVRDNIIYEDEAKKQPFKASRVLVFGRGNSTEKACLLAALFRASGFPAGIQFIKISDMKSIKHYLFPAKWHAITVVYNNGNWIKLDASLDRWSSLERETEPTRFDGIHDASLPQTNWHAHKNYKVTKESQKYLDIPKDIEIFY